MHSNTIEQPSRAMRILMAVPVFGWILRDLMFGDKDNIWYLIGGGLCLWALAVIKWGVLGLYLPAVAAVPVVMVILLLITRG
ncbi:hypothetical protein [Rhodovulum adriaticum]|uniref:Uncharacterized protein n=1 Tax=Rhodovulum adriaticum TaxID=35804 RepID=A0A4R2NJE6_RHOAD|nr:hypothetical protein [Rhodovulum adriaticum]MBK1634704.1 hypothetical protein [Rhodovulum adriaticum]TCP21587.1 hypothetical protein EV656_11054 [Rhodovulum adriaticum]